MATITVTFPDGAFQEALAKMQAEIEQAWGVAMLELCRDTRHDSVRRSVRAVPRLTDGPRQIRLRD